MTHVNVDMINCATSQFVQEPLVKGKEVVILMEITMNNLLSAGALDLQDFLSRVDLLSDLGFSVLISNYSEFYRLTTYFRRYTKEMVGVAMGINNLLEIFNEKYYENLEGGILESLGRLFRYAVKLYVYPMRRGPMKKISRVQRHQRINPRASNVLINAKRQDCRPSVNLTPTFSRIATLNPSLDSTGGPGYFLARSAEANQDNDVLWEKMVPESVVEAIKRRIVRPHQRPGLNQMPLGLPASAGLRQPAIAAKWARRARVRALFSSDTASPNSARRQTAAQHRVGLLYPQRIGDKRTGAARGADQSFYGDHRCQIEPRADQPKSDPCADRAGNPSKKCTATKGHPLPAKIDRIEQDVTASVARPAAQQTRDKLSGRDDRSAATREIPRPPDPSARPIKAIGERHHCRGLRCVHVRIMSPSAM